MMFDTKIAIIIRNDLQVWQMLNVCAFMTSGIVGQDTTLIGPDYQDQDGNCFNGLLKQPVIILSASNDLIKKIHGKALSRDVKASMFIEEMFDTGYDEANRAEFTKHSVDVANVVGLGMRAERRQIDKIAKGAKMQFGMGDM